MLIPCDPWPLLGKGLIELQKGCSPALAGVAQSVECHPML